MWAFGLFYQCGRCPCNVQWLPGGDCFPAQVNPDVKRRVPWSQDEDEKLRALIDKARARNLPISWADIARKLPGRSDQQVKGHWER